MFEDVWKKQGKRNKVTTVSLHHSCYGVVNLAKHLLQTEKYEYVCIGMFFADPLEKTFSKLRQGSGGTYLITAQQVTKNLRIEKTKLQISLDHHMADSSHCKMSSL